MWIFPFLVTFFGESSTMFGCNSSIDRNSSFIASPGESMETHVNIFVKILSQLSSTQLEPSFSPTQALSWQEHTWVELNAVAKWRKPGIDWGRRFKLENLKTITWPNNAQSGQVERFPCLISSIISQRALSLHSTWSIPTVQWIHGSCFAFVVAWGEDSGTCLGVILVAVVRPPIDELSSKILNCNHSQWKLQSCSRTWKLQWN